MEEAIWSGLQGHGHTLIGGTQSYTVASHTARRLPHGDGPADLLQGCPPGISVPGAAPPPSRTTEPSRPGGRTSTTVDGSGPSLVQPGYQGDPIDTRTNLVSAGERPFWLV